MKASEIRRGQVVLFDGEPCRVLEFIHRTPGNLRAFVQVRFRNLLSGNTFDHRYSANEAVESAMVNRRECQVLYRDTAGAHFMDTESYEQLVVDEETAGDTWPWLEAGMTFLLESVDGRPVGVELPSVMELTVVETPPALRGATKNASSKPAVLSNGVTIKIPEFIESGEAIRVDPRQSIYLERVK